MNGWFLLFWAIAAAGMAKWLSMAANRFQGFGWTRPALKRAIGLHNVLLVTYPAVTFFGYGYFGPRLLWNADWSTLSPLAWLVFSAGWSGAVLLVASTIEYWRYRPADRQVISQSRIIDLSADRETYLGNGRARWQAKLPFNEQFSLEVQSRTYRLERLPAAWQGVTIAHFSDCHFRGPISEAYFQRVMTEVAALQADMILFTGDLLDRRECLDWIPQTMGQLTAPLGCYFVLGNHDWYVNAAAEIRQALRDAGWIDLGSRVHSVSHGGATITLCGNEQPWLGTLPNLEGVPSDRFRLLLSHSPDQIGWARDQRIDLMFAGHTHGGQIRLPILGPIYSPSLYGCRYSAGVFWEAPTLMSVTRGVSGREPVRYGCRPEITQVTLHSAMAINRPLPVVSSPVALKAG
jgi:uncharacterized protein